MSKKLLSDEEISEAFEASWATHGDRPQRFARIIEHQLLEQMGKKLVPRLRSAKSLLEHAWPYSQRSDAENAVLANLDSTLLELGFDCAIGQPSSDASPSGAPLS